MKQTAVEWLVEQISTSKYFYKLMEDINSRSTIAQSDIIEQAKEMEKEQLCYFYIKGVEGEMNNPYVTNIEFYNKTFKKTEQ